MSLRVYRPDEPWPRHQKSFWNETLDLAREHGWTYEYLDAKHKSGDLLCPMGEHTITVDKTSTNSESYAIRGKRTIVRTCKHVPGTPDEPDEERDASGSQVASRMARAEALMTTAEKLIACADADIAAIEARRAVDENFAELEDLRMRVDTADLTIADLEEMETQALEQAFALDSAEVAVRTPGAVGAALDDAGAQVDEASATIRRVRVHSSLEDLRGRIEAARNEIGRLRARLEEFSETS